ncbi:DUF4238 domain-containing protein [Agrobacterium rhizogenes]|nr:DUF4238 domain-containing protein [Rhizobium rhizogenes]NTI96359.1 DUF4238 domain-containing protein [Rhizobium rhizogenes]NTJ61085.1 DUF4238 domain-containing protein [Rhizobium rhizogenes]OCJ23847.1 hypothetical protein A6U89_31815 [Agrobacterium sp. B133/95]
MKHHYIPQFYLRPWLGSDNKLLEFRRLKFEHEPLPRLEIKRRGTGETGCEENLYTLHGATKETKQNVERIFMGAVDGKAALARDELLNGVIPQGELRHAWARFLLSLSLRTPEQIRLFKKFLRDYWENPDANLLARYDAARQQDWPSTLAGWLKEENPKSHERSAIIIATRMMQNENVLRMFMGARWWVLDTSTVQRRLMTSDHPLVMTNGLGRPDAHFGLPIGPTRLFIAFMNDAISAKIRSQPVGKLVREANDAVIGQGRKSVYGVNDASTALVKQRMGKRDYFQPLPKEVGAQGPSSHDRPFSSRNLT